MRAFFGIALALIIGSGGAPARAAASPPATRWEAAAIFLGEREPDIFQKDIDANVMELARLAPNSNFKLTVYREFADRAVEYRADPASATSGDWSPLFFKSPAAVQVPGALTVRARASGEKSLIRDATRLKAFFGDAFSSPDARRILFIYGHGQAHRGLQSIKLRELRSQLETSFPSRSPNERPLDILWLDSCFMAGIEVAYELRNVADYFMGSEDDEFSSGSPFDTLALLAAGPSDPGAVARDLGERYIESYSYLKDGSQRGNVLKSSATMTLVETRLLAPLVAKLGSLVRKAGRLAPELRKQLGYSNVSFRMNRKDRVDLGSFLILLARNRQVPETLRAEAAAVLETIGLDRHRATRTNIRVPLVPPVKRSLLVWGYNQWKNGYEGDELAWKRSPSRMVPKSFVPGPLGKNWPARGVINGIVANPFSVDLSTFNYYWADPVSFKPIGKVVTVTRPADTFSSDARTPESPVRWTGYTQGTGVAAERYSGLSVLDPTAGATDLDYLDLDFARETGWGNF